MATFDAGPGSRPSSRAAREFALAFDNARKLSLGRHGFPQHVKFAAHFLAANPPRSRRLGKPEEQGARPDGNAVQQGGFSFAVIAHDQVEAGNQSEPLVPETTEVLESDAGNNHVTDALVRTRIHSPAVCPLFSPARPD